MLRIAFLVGLAVVHSGCSVFQETELGKAVKAHDVNEVRRLLDSDADWSAAIYGAWEAALDNLNPSDPRTFEIVKLIFAKNPQPKVYGFDGNPTRMAANSEFSVTGRNIMGKDRVTSPVEIAARKWSPEAVKFLLDNGLVIQMLLDAGADVNGRDKRHDTALAMAKRVNNHQIAAILVARGAREQ